MGPCVEARRAKGWITADAEMVMGCVPVSEALSAMWAVGWMVRGGRGGRVGDRRRALAEGAGRGRVDILRKVAAG